jgi:hypothetical protein
MDEEIPNLVTSGKSQSVLVDGHRFDIGIYKLEGGTAWTLEVVDEQGTSHVWDDEFQSDAEALSEALKALEEEGAAAFLGNVVQFPRG